MKLLSTTDSDTMGNEETSTIMSVGIVNLDKIFPVGSVYINVGESDPSVLFGGVWKKIGEGRTLVQAGNSKPLGTTGGGGINSTLGR